MKNSRNKNAGKDYNFTEFDKFGFINFRKNQILYELTLDKTDWNLTREQQLARSTKLLRKRLKDLKEKMEKAIAQNMDKKKAINEYNDLYNLFNSIQHKDIKRGLKSITGLTWHHHQIPGIMQLVPKKDHDPFHIGGTAIWADNNYDKNYEE